jgi:hypothetical protein
MVVLDDVTKDDEAFTLRTVSPILSPQSILHQYSQISTKWEENKIP